MALVDLIIRLKDQSSQGIGKIRGAMSGLRGQTQQAAASTQNLAGAIRDGVLQASAIQFAFGKVQEAVGFLNGKFEEAKNLQLEQINAASSFAALTGQSSEQAARFIENLNDRLAKSAAALPGATQDYKQLAIAVQDNVLEAFKDPSGTLNQKGFENTLISMSESFGALTAASTRDINNTSLGLSKALGGASVAELRNIAFFEQNPVILNEIEKRLKEQNKEMKQLSIAERVKLLQEVGAKFITEDFKKQASESVDGLIQSFKSTLFDPSAGIFGIMRDLDPATEGVQSAFSAMNQALIEVIGPSGVFFQVSGLLQDLGIELPDPMLALKNSVDFVVKGLKRVNQGLTYVRDFVKAGGSATDAFRLAATLFSTGFDSGAIASNISDFFTTAGDQIGGFFSRLAAMAAPLFNQGVALISEFFSNPAQLYGIGVAFGGMLGRVNAAVITFLGSVNYPQLLITVGRVAIGILAALAGAIGGLALSILPGIGMMVSNTGQSILAGAQTMVLGIGQTIVDGLGLLGSLVKATLGKIPVIGAVISALIDTQLGAFQAFVSGGIGGLFVYIINTGRAVVTALQQKLGQMVEQVRSIPVIGNLVPQAASPPAQPTQAAQPAVAVGSRYSGQVGWAAGGFLGNLLNAAQQELSRMPAGANLMLANSSETILPQGVFGSLIRALVPMLAAPQPQDMFGSLIRALVPTLMPSLAAPAPQLALPQLPGIEATPPAAVPAVASPAPAIARSGGNRNVFNFTINGGSDSAEAIAQAVMAAIQTKFVSEINAQLGGT